ncbi:MAG TPA: inorganic phosphate transporter, partial [Solirubrobacterales bacterium]|nr:inorganic phosphate transporter [Solirubrobacterales bacterium]
MSSDLVIAIVVAAALVFGFTNGFHDTLDVVSTAVSTGAAPPQVAIAVAALLNFAGAFVSVEVATTIAHDVVDAAAITPTVVFAGLIGAIVWNLATWWLGLPSSSSHALIGGVVGAALAAAGTGAVVGGGLLDKVLLPALVAPLVAFLVAGVLIVIAYRLFGRRRPGPVTRGFRYAQVVSGGLLALSHGANDVQKTTGVITLALIANGTLGSDASPPFWAIVSAAVAIAAGTYSGGWRMLRMKGARIIKMDAAQGFSAQSAGATVILASTFLGFPISTTQAINGGVMGAGTVRRVSAAR